MASRALREIGRELRLGGDSVESALRRLWRNSRALRTVKPNLSNDKIFRGRAGTVSNLRQYPLYLFAQDGVTSANFQGMAFAAFSKKYADKRGAKGGTSKAKVILAFIETNRDRAFYSKELVAALKDKGVKPSDIMSNVRRFERKGVVYVRGYRMHDRQTPFKEGYLLTWIDIGKPREQAIEEAVQKTSKVLDSTASTSPIIERIHLIRDQILEATKLRDLVSFEFIQNKLNCSPCEGESAIERALQLYPDLHVVKLFNAYNYYYHMSMAPEDLKVALAFKQNYVLQMKGIISIWPISGIMRWL